MVAIARESAAARELGVAVSLLDHDSLTQFGDAPKAIRFVSVESDDAIYRGWMVSSRQYSDLASVLERKGVQLRTTPESFRSAHELPGWYNSFKEFTPASVWCGMDEVSDLPNLVATLRSGPAVVKDFVKSMKHYWHEAAFVPEVHNKRGLLAVVTRLLELRDDDLVGGVVVREFEDFLPGEARTWWVDGVCRLTTAHPDTPELIAVPERLDEIATSVSALGAPLSLWTLLDERTEFGA